MTEWENTVCSQWELLNDMQNLRHHRTDDEKG